MVRHHVRRFAIEFKREDDPQRTDGTHAAGHKGPEKSADRPVTFFALGEQHNNREQDRDQEVGDSHADEWPQQAFPFTAPHDFLADMQHRPIQAPRAKRHDHKN